MEEAAVGLNENDARPEGISVRDAYAAVRVWYQGNVDRFAEDPRRGRYAAEAKAYIQALPAPDEATLAQMQNTLRRVLSSDIEWGYHETDGQYKMAAYAFAAFEAAGVEPFG